MLFERHATQHNTNHIIFLCYVEREFPHTAMRKHHTGRAVWVSILQSRWSIHIKGELQRKTVIIPQFLYSLSLSKEKEKKHPVSTGASLARLPFVFSRSARGGTTALGSRIYCHPVWSLNGNGWLVPQEDSSIIPQIELGWDKGHTGAWNAWGMIETKTLGWMERLWYSELQKNDVFNGGRFWGLSAWRWRLAEDYEVGSK
jgi:hypothetical protein